MPRSRRKTIQKSLKKNRLPILLVLVGILLILVPLFYYQRPIILDSKHQVSSPSKVSSKSQPFKVSTELLSKKETTQAPSKIIIPNYKVDLKVIEAPVINGFWELSETTASHGVGSANPGENGNIVVFAHARDDLFGPLRDMKVGDKIYLLTKDHWATYQVSETKLVNPDQVEVIAPTKQETLTLFTCSGFLDSKRLIVKALPI